MLPTNRQIKTLGEMTEIIGGGTPKTDILEYRENGTIERVTPTDLGKIGEIVELSDTEKKITESGLKNSSAKLLPVGTILFSSRASIGKIAIAKKEVCTNQGFANFICKEGVNNYFLSYGLLRFIPEITLLSNSTTFKEVSKGSLKNFEIPLPPLNTQQAIVAKLDQIHAEISANQSAIHQQLAQLDELWQSSLDQIFSNKEWGKMKIKDFAEIRSGKRLPKGNFVQDIKTEYPYIRVSDFGEDGTIDLSNIKYITEDIFQQISRYIITDKDLYISIAGTIGKTGIIPSLLNGANLTENAVRLVYKEESKIYNKYVLYFTKSPSFAKQAGLATRTVAMPKLAITRLKDIKIPLPDLATQKAAVAKLDQIHEHISQLRVDYIAQLAQYEELRASVLDQAFKGQLVE